MRTHTTVKFATLALVVCLAPACQPDTGPEDSAEFRAAQEAYDKGEYAVALRRAEALRDAYPESALGWTSMAEAHDALDDHEQAIESYRRALELEPFDYEIHTSLCDALDSLGRLEGEIESYRRAVEAEPENARAHVVLGIALSMAERIEAAIESGRRAIELDPDDAWAHAFLGYIFAQVGETVEGIELVRRAIELDPDVASFHEFLGDGLAELGKMGEAIESYRRAIELDPDDADLHYFLGELFLVEEGRMEEAIESFRRAVEIDPDNGYYHEVLGDGLAELGKMGEAIESYRRAAELDPDDADLHYFLGEFLVEEGRMEEAIESFRRAVEIDPQDADVRSSLAAALREMGRPKEAKAVQEIPPTIVGEIVVEWVGPARASDEEVLAAMVTRVGDELDSSVARPLPRGAPLPSEKFDEDIASLYKGGFADRARFFAERMEGSQFRLTVELRAPSKLGSVEVEGAEAISVEVIVALADLEVGESLDETAVKEGQDRIRNLYRHRGFADASVSYRILPPGEDGRSSVVYQVRETALLLLLRKVVFVGNTAFSTRELSYQMELPKLEGDQRLLERTAVAADIRRIEEHYQNHGYLTARVENASRVPVDDEFADLVITVFAGELHTVNAVQVDGMQALARDDLVPRLRLEAGDVWSGSDLKHDIKLIEDEYGRRGYVDARVRPTLEAAGPNQIAVRLQVSEGKQFRVGRISVEGNVTVDEEVILREVLLRPGELFDTMKLEASRVRLTKLNLFKAVELYLEDSNKPGVKDLLIRVLEKLPGQ